LELYERLFSGFITREVDKHFRSDSPEQREYRIDMEWRRLSAVALSMFNRDGYVVTEAELNEDLQYLVLQGDSSSAMEVKAGRALTGGQLIVGRFFFIHESRASRDTGTPERSFEFLHATFSDFLTARLIVEALSELAEERIHQRSRWQRSLDAGFFYGALSFATITRRAPLRDFCYGMLTSLDDAQRAACRDLVIELLPDAGYPHRTWSLGEYEPRRLRYAARHAAFSANLVTLAVMLSSEPVNVADLVDEPVTANWRQQTSLWFSQLHPEDWRRLWQDFRVSWRRETPPTLFIEIENGSDVSVYDSLPWRPDAAPAPFELHETLTPDVRVAAQSRAGLALRRSAFLQTTVDMREYIYTLMPYWDTVGDMQWWSVDDRGFVIDGHILMRLLFDPVTPNTISSRIELYRTTFNRQTSSRYQSLVSRRLADDMLLLTETGTVKALLPQGGTTILAEKEFFAEALALLAVQLGGGSTRVRELYRVLCSELGSSNELLEFQSAVWQAFGQHEISAQGDWILNEVYGRT
jgi:hypothetical protein